MTALKIILLTIAIFSLVNITTALVQMSLVLKNKGKVNSNGWYFTAYSFLVAVSTAILVVIW